MIGKRILICCNRTLGIGGIEKALTTFLKAFDTKNNVVTLVLSDSEGALFPQLPTDNLNIVYTNSINSAELLRDDIKHFRLAEIAKGIYNRIMLRLNKNWYARIMYSYRVIQRKLCFPEPFDCAISFTTDYSDLSMVLAAKTEKRIAFVHADASQNPYIAKLNDKLLQQFNKIFCVSESSKELFLNVHPHCSNAMDIFHNIVDIPKIHRLGEESVDDMILDGTPTICTVGRLSPEKGQSLIPPAAALLKENGYRFRWYLVGDGSLRHELEQRIVDLGLDSDVILLGAKTNPYPYMKHCDVYVQTSFTEAYCITVREALAFRGCVVSTDFTSIEEQLQNGKNGLIVQKKSEALFEGIRTLLDHPELREKFAENLSHEACDSLGDLQKLYQYIED